MATNNIPQIENYDSDYDSDNETTLYKGGQSRRKFDCRNGLKCLKLDCPFDHPTGWKPCRDGKDCEDYDCESTHPFQRKKRCNLGIKCKTRGCSRRFLHPVIHANSCPTGVQCKLWDCQNWHPKDRPGLCPYRTACCNSKCTLLHPSDRTMCENDIDCNDYDCELNHSPTRPTRCEHGRSCDNYHCQCLHPNDWDPCEQGRDCDNADCPHAVHPPDRVLPILKSFEQRHIDRERAGLPILAIKDQFCRRLENERILVITAETGSGKSTQLPQYLAEYFGGLIVCTQPRVLAAVALARRVAEEYDGTSVGYNVGYRVGHSSMGKDKNRVPGNDILFMTDGTFIRESQLNIDIMDMKVLMIDEAHERTLNTDIVLGIAKQMLDTQPKDFYVVISSATIVAEDFLRFFGKSDVEPLNVLGRTYDVDVEYAGQKRVPIENYAVSIVREEYNHYEGNILVFLPGQTQIDNAVEFFNRRPLENCRAFPLYSALSPEEQDLVLRFDTGPDNNQRMVVFCTNIAETSLTINNVRLVIDSGLVNEGRYDYETQLTVMESARISLASAEQRRGRAGRTANGNCIRLYNEVDLVDRDTIPQILRCSLDITVLQLLNLDLDPFTFTFMNRPDDERIQASFDLLKTLGCIDRTGHLNEQGKLFGKLGIDPRYSAFLLDAYLEHKPILELAAIVVAICIAPSSPFVIEGETKEEKESARNRIQKSAQRFKSDLFHIVEQYKTWQSIALLDPETHTCKTCHKSYAKGDSCGPCRAAYSRTHLLNNKIFNYIESMSDELRNTIIKSEAYLNANTLSDADESLIVGKILAKHFPERCGRLLIPPEKKIDARMDKNNLPARLSETTTFLQRKSNNMHFIATLLLKAVSGNYIIDRLHPLPAPTNDEDNRHWILSKILRTFRTFT